MFKKTVVASAVALGCLGTFVPMALAHCESFEYQKITGGGFVTSCDGGKNTFGFNITPNDANDTLTVHLEYNDHNDSTNPIQIHVNTTEPLDANASDVELNDANYTDVGIDFYVWADVRSASGDQQELIHVTTADYGEPGTSDVFHLDIVQGPDAGYSSGTFGATNQVIQGGNIQIHY